jgi:hypothetical protein
MTETTFWIRDRFPIVYEGGEAKAILVDITSFDQMELIIDNLLNREEEPEDAILAASAILQRLVAQARQEPSSPRMPTTTTEEQHGGIPGEC